MFLFTHQYLHIYLLLIYALLITYLHIIYLFTHLTVFSLAIMFINKEIKQELPSDNATHINHRLPPPRVPLMI